MMQMAAWLGLLVLIVGVDVRLGHRVPRGRRRNDTASDGLMVVATAVTVAGGPLLVVTAGGTLLGPWPSIAVGLPVGVAGILLRIAAMRELDDAYCLQINAEQDRLVTGGVYSVVRHPGYAGLVLQFVGLGIVAGAWPALLAVLPLIVLLPVRIREEEDVLVRRFAGQYRAYARSVPGLLPATRRTR